ncbi:sh2 domain containing protein [Stylonychia lemnae]|uniref:Sh2 domain containing protein n=1 Tax=Stylonychia lemnae TaxID=5949 RepID=A0A077ZZH8_STYLE|nr:sh2 domain containing protein [Stylonychia lemnae]|eukprot:CDW73918.1 sh2 domain containing protein [Stylonychia lemnae]
MIKLVSSDDRHVNEELSLLKQNSLSFAIKNNTLQRSLSTSKPNDNKNLKNQSQIHISYLYSSPLVVQINDKLYDEMLEDINFKEEFRQIMQGLEVERLQIKYRYQLATVQNLIDCLRQRTIGLHFSGHGLQNRRENFQDQSYFMKIRDKGDILIFEEQNGGVSQFLFEKDLKQILSQYPSDLQFVVVASCHSENCGLIFKKAGASHVICIQQNKQLNDEVAITFSRTFYTNVFASNLSICQAYQVSLNHIEMMYGQKESRMFKLITQINHHCKNKQQKSFDNLQVGRLKNLLPLPKLMILPFNQHPYIARNMEIHSVIKMIQDNRVKIVKIFGMSGSGKSTILKKATLYLADRDQFTGGIIYINLSGIQTVIDAIYQIVKRIYNIDELAINQKLELIRYLNHTIQEKETLKILLSTSIYIDGLENLAIKHIKGLSPAKSLQILQEKTTNNELQQKNFEYKSINDLHNFTLQINPEFKNTLRLCEQSCKLISHRGNYQECINQYLLKHPIFKILDQPLAISIVSSLMINHTLVDIYQLLISNKFFTEIGDSLLLSVDEAIKSIFLGEKIFILQILCIIGQTLEGVSFSELKLISENDQDTLEALSYLDKISLIYYDQEKDQYQLHNIVRKYLEIKIQDSYKREANIKLMKFYLKMIKTIKRNVHQGSQELESLYKFLDQHERNIIHSIQFFLNRNTYEFNNTVELVGENLVSKQYTKTQFKRITFERRYSNTFSQNFQARSQAEVQLQPQSFDNQSQQTQIIRVPSSIGGETVIRRHPDFDLETESMSINQPKLIQQNSEQMKVPSYDFMIREDSNRNKTIGVEIQKQFEENEPILSDHIEEWEKQRYQAQLDKLDRLDINISDFFSISNKTSNLKITRNSQVTQKMRLITSSQNKLTVRRGVLNYKMPTTVNRQDFVDDLDISIRSHLSKSSVNSLSKTLKPQSQQNIQKLSQEIEKQLMIDLAYEYLSSVAINSIDIPTFLELKSKFLILEQDLRFKANVSLLLVYQFLRVGNYQSAATELQTLLQIYNQLKSNQGLAIVNFYHSLVFMLLRNSQAQQQAFEYLQKSEKIFSKLYDSNGLKYCQYLRQLLNQKSALDILLRQAQKNNLMMNQHQMFEDKQKDNQKVSSDKYDRLLLVRDIEFLNLLLNPV